MKKHYSYNTADTKNQKIEACPISYDQVNKNLIKAYSSIVLIILLYTLFTGNHWLMYIITIDFFIRVFAGIKFSPLCNFLTATLKITPLKPVLVNAGSKKIAAKVGLIFAIGVCVFYFLGLNLLSNIFTLMFALAIALDLFFDALV